MTTETPATVHPFEAAGLGKAPFRYIGMEAQDVRDGDRIIGESDGCEVSTKPGGTCAYCGTYIVDMYNVRSADGKVFHVGSDCIGKCCGPKLVAAVEADDRKAKADRKRTNETARITAAKARLSTDVNLRAKLADLPHPKMRGTLLSYVEWMMRNAGHSGRFAVTKLIERN